MSKTGIFVYCDLALPEYNNKTLVGFYRTVETIGKEGSKIAKLYFNAAAPLYQFNQPTCLDVDRNLHLRTK